MSNGIKVVKRKGHIEPLDLEKMHKMVELACDGLAGVSASQVEIQSGIQFYDGMTTADIQGILVRSASDLIDLDAPKPVFIKDKFKIDLENIASLNKSHPARIYLEQSRQISSKILENMYYCKNFKEWTNAQKQTFDDVTNDEPRIIIPLRYNGTLIGFQGRSLLPKSKIKYITIMLEEDAPKIYGLDNINTSKTVYVTEGPFDSTFISNSIAMCGADGDVKKWGITDPVWIYDNEPRNKQIVERLSTTINSGDRVVIFPKNILEKDINDMVLSGQNVQKMVESNIYQGLEAKLKLQDWKRV